MLGVVLVTLASHLSANCRLLLDSGLSLFVGDVSCWKRRQRAGYCIVLNSDRVLRYRIWFGVVFWNRKNFPLVSGPDEDILLLREP